MSLDANIGLGALLTPSGRYQALHRLKGLCVRCPRVAVTANHFLIVVFKKGQPKRELAQLSMLLQSGHPDQEGIKLGIADWFEEDARDAIEELGE